MKKFLLFMFCVMISALSYADVYSCQVPGHNATVKVSERTATTDSYGTLPVSVKVTGEKPIAGSFNVLVNIYDGLTNEKVDAVSVTVIWSNGSGLGYSKKLKPKHAYIMKISNVSCN